MNKKVVFLTIGIILLLASSLSYVFLKPKADNSVSETADSSTTTPTTESQTRLPSNDQPGSYIAYSEDAVRTATGTKLLFFHAPWCPQCREMDASIQSGGVPDGVTVLKVDYDSNQALRQKYGVTLQTTFVKIDDEGDKVESYVAYDEPRFASVERELLR